MNLTIICVGSGPSLTPEDCELAQSSGHPIIAVNSSWTAVPECDVIYASDHSWWRMHSKDITIPAERWTNSVLAARDYGCHLAKVNTVYNSGLAAIHLAELLGATRIVLLGYDCQPTNGKAHWHDPHRGNNPNEISYRIWRKQFRETRRQLCEKIVNCSRETALTCFARARFEDQITCTDPQESAASSPCANR